LMKKPTIVERDYDYTEQFIGIIHFAVSVGSHNKLFKEIKNVKVKKSYLSLFAHPGNFPDNRLFSNGNSRLHRNL
ncbi:unnamed protein product, partial [marine sediment metagenome]